MAQLTFRYQGLGLPMVARFDVPRQLGRRPRAAQGRGRAAAPDGDRGGVPDGRQAGKVAHSLSLISGKCAILDGRREGGGKPVASTG
jgi:hypothetical protein